MTHLRHLLPEIISHLVFMFFLRAKIELAIREKEVNQQNRKTGQKFLPFRIFFVIFKNPHVTKNKYIRHSNNYDRTRV